MATNNLASTLAQEKITPNQLAANCTLSSTTVRAVAVQKRTPAPSTKERMVAALNRLSKKSFTVEQIFPPKARPAKRKR